MRPSALLPTAFTLLTSTLAAPLAIIHNACPFPVYAVSVGTKSSSLVPIPPSAYHLEEQYFSGIGTAIKVTRSSDGLYKNEPVLHLSYTYTAGQSIYYDLSSHNGFAFEGWRVVLGGGNEDVEEIVWEGEARGQRTVAYFGETDLVLTLCAE